MKPFVILGAALALGSAIAIAAEVGGEASAPDASQRGKRWAACSLEIQKFCGDIERGRGKIRACLDEHTADLSDGCKQRMAERRSRPSEQPN